MKKLLSYIIGLCVLVTAAQAQTLLVKSIPAGTITNILQGQYRLQSVSFVSTSATNTNDLSFLYDTRTNSTNLVRPAYYSYSETNIVYTNVYTNSLGIVTTNFFNAISNVATSNDVSTAAAPVLSVIQTMGTTLPVGRASVGAYTTLGVTVYSSAPGTIFVTYAPAF